MKVDNGEMLIAEAIEAPSMAGEQSGCLGLGCLPPLATGSAVFGVFCVWHITFELERCS